MNRISLFFTVAALFMITLCSCGDDEGNVMEESISIASRDTLEYLVSGLLTEGWVKIRSHPSNGSISRIEYTLKDNRDGTYYVYSPKKDFRGTDIAEIEIAYSAGGSDYNADILKLYITVLK